MELEVKENAVRERGGTAWARKEVARNKTTVLGLYNLDSSDS